MYRYALKLHRQKKPWNHRYQYSSLRDFLQLAEGILIDFPFGETGGFVWLPYGNSIKNLVFTELQKDIRAAGFEYYTVPVMVPIDLLEKQSQLRSFRERVFYVHSRSGQHDDKYLRPDGVVQANQIIAHAVTAKEDLPMRLFFNSHIHRDGKSVPMFNSLGANMIEGYSANATVETAAEELQRVHQMLSQLPRKTYLSGIFVKRPPEGNHHEIAEQFFGFDAILPTGRTIQPISQYYHGTKYSRVFDCKAGDDYVYLSSWGFSERLIATMLMSLADDKGLVVPPEFAPLQCAVMVLTASARSYAEQVFQQITKKGVTSILDTSDEFLPKRFLKYERIGVPLRLDIGDVESRTMTVKIVSRVGETKIVPLEALETGIEDMILSMQKRLADKAREREAASLVRAASVEGLSDITRVKEFGLCNDEACRVTVESNSSGEVLGWSLLKSDEKCIVCGKPATLAYSSRRH